MAGTDLHLGETVGCLSLGVLFAVILYGCGIAQTLFYIRHYPDDKMLLKSLVAFTCLLDTARTILDIQVAWYMLVQNHAQPHALSLFTKTFLAEYFLAALTILIVQLSSRIPQLWSHASLTVFVRSYFVQVIWKLFGQMDHERFQIPLTALAVVLALLSFGACIGVIYKAQSNLLLMAVLSNVTAIVTVQTLTAVIADVYIAVSLCLVLRGKSTGFRRFGLIWHYRRDPSSS
ncbi:hypothetical protein AcV5_005009 [Taiwanofungus camphoratus]|nr:hypothetical protein AcV5_005009 [Antrodia cinnamomea]